MDLNSKPNGNVNVKQLTAIPIDKVVCPRPNNNYDPTNTTGSNKNGDEHVHSFKDDQLNETADWDPNNFGAFGNVNVISISNDYPQSNIAINTKSRSNVPDTPVITYQIKE